MFFALTCYYSETVAEPSAIKDAKFTGFDRRKELPLGDSSVGNTPTRKKFKDILPTTPLMTTGPTLYYEDTMKFRVS